MTQFRLELIAAIAANGVIGRQGRVPWHLPDDLRHFKALTTGHPVIMGRRTFESIGRALPGRRSIVVSSTLGGPMRAGLELARSLDEALRLAAASTSPAFIIGGAVLYSAAISRVRVMHLTELDEAVEGDAFFPPFAGGDWRLTNAVRHEQDVRHSIGFRFCTYERVRGGDPDPTP